MLYREHNPKLTCEFIHLIHVLNPLLLPHPDLLIFNAILRVYVLGLPPRNNAGYLSGLTKDTYVWHTTDFHGQATDFQGNQCQHGGGMLRYKESNQGTLSRSEPTHL